MNGIKEWDELPIYEKVRSLPDRHPYPVKAFLYLMFNVCPEVPWKVFHQILERMGYVEIKDERDMGGGYAFVTKGWTMP